NKIITNDANIKDDRTYKLVRARFNHIAIQKVQDQGLLEPKRVGSLLKKSSISSSAKRKSCFTTLEKAEPVGKRRDLPFKSERAYHPKEPKRGTESVHWEWTSAPASLFEQLLKIVPCGDDERLAIDPPKPS